MLTPDALYRVVTNYTDGFLSRIALARTPDNTFTPLSERLYRLTPEQEGKPRSRRTKNDTIYEQLADRFTTEEAYDTSISVRGFEVTKGRVFTMLYRWEKQGMVERLDKGVYRKTQRAVVL